MELSLTGLRLRARLRKENNRTWATCSQSTPALLHQKRTEHMQQSLSYQRPDTALSWPGDIKFCSHTGHSDGGRSHTASDDHTLPIQLYKNALITAGTFISELTLITNIPSKARCSMVPGSVQYCNGTTHIS